LNSHQSRTQTAVEKRAGERDEWEISEIRGTIILGRGRFSLGPRGKGLLDCLHADRMLRLERLRQKGIWTSESYRILAKAGVDGKGSQWSRQPWINTDQNFATLGRRKHGRERLDSKGKAKKAFSMEIMEYQCN